MTNRISLIALVLACVPIAASACSAADPGSACHPADPACNHVSSGDDSGSSSGDDASNQQMDSGSQPGNDSGSTTHDAGHTPGSGDGGGPQDSSLPPEGGAGGFAAACNPQNNQCPTAYPVCFNFNTKGPHCTKNCQSANDCPGGSGGLGCSGMGVCKIP